MNKRLYILLLLLCIQQLVSSQKPNIIIIVADDLGWNDVGFHGSNEIPTPNIDMLAYTGIILNNYYTMPMCTPSRAALMTGRHPIHTGMQENVINPPEPWGLGLDEKLLSEYLKQEQYKTHGIGKWHLGFFKKEYTPTYRGFDSFYGSWGSHQDYYDHTMYSAGYLGYDLRDYMNVATEVNAEYITRIYTEKAEKVILKHNTTKPLFLYVAHLATHIGNSDTTLEAPQETIDLFEHIKDYNRRVFAAMVYELDLSIGKIIKALGNKNMLENSIIIFTTDNGGAAGGREGSASTNWPLRGTKESLWEGGVRGVSLIWSQLLNSSGYISNQLSHIQDWLPTIINAINSTIPLLNIDGINLWQAFNNQNITNIRDNLLITISDAIPYYALRYNQWKLLSGTINNGSFDDIYLPNGRENRYNFTALYTSDVYKSLQLINSLSLPNNIQIIRLRNQLSISCNFMNNTNTSCNALEEICLFNIENDPCEINNIAHENQDIVEYLLKLISEYNSTVIEPRNQAGDPYCDPLLWNNTWINWQDYPPYNDASTTESGLILLLNIIIIYKCSQV